MLYEVTITYENKEISFKFPKKYFEGKYTLPEFIKHTREYNEQIYKKAEENKKSKEHLEDYKKDIEELKKMENGNTPITQDWLKEFVYVFYLPKKITKLGIISNPSIKEKLGEKLYQLRTTRGNQKQSDVAKAIGIPTNTYTGYESGRNELDLETLVKIADLYKVSTDQLLGRTNY